MIIILILVTLLVLGILAIIICNVLHNWEYEWLGILGGVITTISSILLIASLVIIMFIQILSYGDYLQRKQQREVIIVQYERTKDVNSIINGDVGSLSSVYRNIVNFNNDIIFSQTYKDSLWIGWFVNPYYADLELIELE